MTHMLSSEGTVKLSDRDERARAAVKAFRAMQPTLTAYARVLTKRKNVRVEMAVGDNGSTDGERIFYRPPIALGDPTPHNRQLCDKRDESKQLLCSACQRRESVLVVIYHEIAHIAFESFADLTDEERARAMKAALELVPGRHGEAMRARVAAAPYWRTRRALDLSGLVSEYLPMLVNALEDARVNNEQWKARKGTKLMFEAEVNRIFNEGVEYREPTTGEIKYIDWRDRPQNSQVLVGVLTKASGYDYSGWFIPPVVEALDDEKITALCRQMGTVRSAAGVLELAFPILARLKELGFCLEKFDEPEPEPEPEEEQPPQPEGESDDEPDTKNEGSESESDTESSSADSTESQGDGTGDRSDSEESEPESDTDSDAGSEPGEDSGEGDALGDEPDDAGRGGDDPSDDSEEASGESGGEDSDEPSEAGGDPAEGDLTDDESDETSEASGSPEAGGDSAGAGAEPSKEAEPYDESDDVDSGADGQEASGSGAESESEGDPSDDAAGTEGSAGDRVDPAGITGPSSGSDGPDSGPSGDTSDDAPAEDESLDSSGVSASGNDGLPEEDDSDGGEGSRPEDVEDGLDRWDEDREEFIDTGADEGHGGTMILEEDEKSWDEIPMGDPDDAGLAVAKWSGHEDAPKSVQETALEAADNAAIEKAIVQGIYFETPSRHIHGVREHFWGQPIEVGGTNISRGWDADRLARTRLHRHAVGLDGDLAVPESILGGALLAMRAAFSDNKRGKHQMHLKSGKINANTLGKRAPLADERLFKRTIRPGKKDYFVILGLDISGSTIGLNIHLIKRAAMAQANLLNRMGIKFAIYAHTGDYHYGDTSGTFRGNELDLDIYHVKDPEEPWNAATQERLEKLAPASCNLDGHTVEYYRKLCDRRPETDKIILYYSDGKMPAENHDEELEILQREIRECDRRGYTLLGVGVRTDSPARHGLPTVQVDEDGDIVKVVKHLEKALLKK